MILGDSLQVMASLAEREGLRGQIQCIYFDPPYGIKFNSNFQWSTNSRDVKDGKFDHITREPEQVKAFRDTWKDGIHSYLTYLRDRLTVAHALLKENGSLFVQIGDENLHKVRSLLDEVFGNQNSAGLLIFVKTASLGGDLISPVTDYILWYAKDISKVKYRPLYIDKEFRGKGGGQFYKLLQLRNGIRRRATSTEIEGVDNLPQGCKPFQLSSLTSQSGGEKSNFSVPFQNKIFTPGKGFWKTTEKGILNLIKANRIEISGSSIRYVRFLEDFPAAPLTSLWTDTGTGSFTTEKTYVVQTSTKVVQRCVLMASDPGDIVLDPTCGSGTTATVAEQWGRRWITIDTSRVALALARARIMGARYPFYLLADSVDGQLKEAEINKLAPSIKTTTNNIRHGFVCDRVPHVTLKSIANNGEIDIICQKWEEEINLLLQKLNRILNKSWSQWEIPVDADSNWSVEARDLHNKLSETRTKRQNEIDTSIAAKAEIEYLFDKPYEDKKRIRVAGPFTVESISPHRYLTVDEHDNLRDPLKQKIDPDFKGFAEMILENLKSAGVEQARKEDKIDFISLTPWPGRYICAEGKYMEGVTERRAAIFVGPEFGTVQRVDLVAAARETGDAAFDVLIACAFNYEAHATEFSKLGKIPVLKARMNADLHMAENLKNTGKGNLFVIFGEPEIDILPAKSGKLQVRIKGVDVFHPSTGEVRSDGADGIACWFIDTDYNEESFFVRHAYFLGANDPYGSLKKTLKAEINDEAWESLHSDTSRPFPKPKSGRIAVKVINHLGDEVMKVYKIE
jgi:adenine-specific DNA-methyltransferase